MKLRALLTATAIAVGLVAAHGAFGLLAILAYAWASSMIGTGNTAKTRDLENRLNTAMGRIPVPQPNPGGTGNNTYGFSNGTWTAGNSSYGTGNTSYQVSTGWNCAGSADNGNVTSGQIGGASAHYHAMAHGHYYGNAAADINAIQYTLATLVNAYNQLRQTASDHITAYNAAVGWNTALANGLNTLQGNHTQLLNAHNDLVNRMNNAGILR